VADVDRPVALVSVVAPADRAVFSLEMGADGVRLHLRRALLGDLLAVSDLALRVPNVRYPFDYTAGPRALQSHLADLESVTLEVRLEAVERAIAGGAGPVRAGGVAGGEGRLVVHGTAGDTPFTVRVRIEPGGPGEDLRLEVGEPRVYGWTALAWDAVASEVGARVPAELRGGGGGIRLLRPLLAALLAPLGFKVPRTAGVVLAAVEILPRAVVLRFREGARAAVPGRPRPVAGTADPEAAAREALSDLGGGASAAAEDRFLRAGVVVPRLWSEVLARAAAAGEERPERVLPHLAGLLVAAKLPQVAGPADVARLAGRLVAALDAADDGVDLVLAGRLVATVADRMDPADALATLDAVTARVADPEILLAAAEATDRLGRADEARRTRTRALSLVPAGRARAVLEATAERLVDRGLAAAAGSWLDDVARACAEGRFGSEGPALRRLSIRVRAAHLAVAPDGAARSRDLLRSLLRDDPGDREAIDLLLALAETDGDVAEAVAAYRQAAVRAAGGDRAALLRAAARAMDERLGLRHQAASALEEALDAEPRDDATAEALDALWTALRRPHRRLELAEARLRWTTEGPARALLLARAGDLAEQAGRLEAAEQFLAERLRTGPTDRAALSAARRVRAARGDVAGLRTVLEALVDLAEDGAEKASLLDELGAADAAGGPDEPIAAQRERVIRELGLGRLEAAEAACARLAGSLADPAERVRALLDLADLRAMIPGCRPGDALDEAAGIAAGAGGAAIRACAAALRERGVLLATSDPEGAAEALERAAGLDPGDAPTRAALAAAYRASGRATLAAAVEGDEG
jgi:tetratricopeptide (TPR) repeat protein